MKSLLENNSNKPVLLTPSKWLNQISSEVFPGIRSVLLPNCISDEFFNQENNSVDLTEKRRIQKVGFISLDLNNPYKGLDIFLKALNKLGPMVKKDLTVVLIGDGRVNDLPTDVNFVFPGKLLGHQRVEVMSVLDLVVIPSKQDNMPNVMCEALSLGIPVIGARVGGIPEILEQFDMPIFDSGDDQTLSEMLEEALVNGLPKVDRNLAFELFSSESYAKNVLSVYNSN
jgi:glycosyltransferase involved in cell wall biosynthesis